MCQHTAIVVRVSAPRKVRRRAAACALSFVPTVGKYAGLHKMFVLNIHSIWKVVQGLQLVVCLIPASVLQTEPLTSMRLDARTTSMMM